MLLLFAAITVASETPMPTPIGRPGDWIKTSDYPRSALRAFAQGTTDFTLKVDADGHVADCTVTQSSGNADLDTATCTLVSVRAQFKPATDSEGHAIESRYHNRVLWRFPSTIPIYAFASRVDFDVEKDGSITSCINSGAESEPSGSARTALERICDGFTGSRRFSAVGADGTAMRGRHHVTMQTIVAIDGTAPPTPAFPPQPPHP